MISVIYRIIEWKSNLTVKSHEQIFHDELNHKTKQDMQFSGATDGLMGM